MPRGGRILRWLAYVLVVGWAVVWWPYTVDDSYITYRYADNLAHGHGPVYNPGERVEGYSSPAWMGILAASIALGMGPVLVSKLLGLACGLLVLVVLDRALKRQGCGEIVSGLACLVLASLPTMHVYTVSGMETVAFALAVAAAALLPWQAGSDRLRLATTACGVLFVVLMRPEGLLTAALLTGLWMAAGPGRGARPGAAAGWVVVAAFFLARWSYYGSWLPNTFVAKPSPIIRTFAGGHIGFGLFKLFDSVRDNLVPALAEAGGTVALLLALAGLALKPASGALRSAALCAASGIAFIVYARSDWMLGQRFFFPFIAPLLFAAAVGADQIWTRISRWGGVEVRRLGAAAAGAVLVWSGWSVVQTAEFLHRHGEGTVNTAMNAEVYERIGLWLKERARPGDRLLAYEVGAVGYASGVPIIDQHGLITTQVARIVQWAEGDFREIRTAKDRDTMNRIVEFCAAQKPEWFLVRSVRPLPVGPGAPLPAGFAMDAMQNALLARFGDEMVLAEGFPMRPDSAGWKDDRYLLLRRRPAGASAP